MLLDRIIMLHNVYVTSVIYSVEYVTRVTYSVEYATPFSQIWNIMGHIRLELVFPRSSYLSLIKHVSNNENGVYKYRRAII